MNDINLIPEKRRTRKRHQRKRRLWLRICAIYIGCLGCMLGSAYAMWTGDDEALTKKLENTEILIEQGRESQIALRKQLALCRGQLHINDTIQHQPDWSRLLLLIGEAVGEEVALTTCQLVTLDDQNKNVIEQLGGDDEATSAETLLTKRDYRLRILGFARTQTAVSLFVLRLERLELFNSVRLGKSRRQDFLGEQAIAFTIQCEI